MAKNKSEAEIQKEILTALNDHGCTVIRTNAGMVVTAQHRHIKLAPPGWPDCTGFEHETGRIVLIEVKSKTGRLRDVQKDFGEFIAKYPKAIYGVARSADEALEIVRAGLGKEVN